MRKTKKNMKFRNKKKNYYKRYSNNRGYINRRLPLLAKAGMIANRSLPTTMPMGKPVGLLSSLFRLSSVPVGTVIHPDALTRDSLYPALQDEPPSVPASFLIRNTLPSRLMGTPLYSDNFSEVPVSLYPELPPTPLRSWSNEDYLDAVDYELDLKNAEIKLEEAQRAAASATAARKVAEAYVIKQQRAVDSWRENAIHSLFSGKKAQAQVKEAEERLENAEQAIKEAITMEKAAVAVKAVAEKELQDATIKADEFKAAPKKSLPRKVMDVTQRIAKAVRGSRSKKVKHIK